MYEAKDVTSIAVPVAIAAVLLLSGKKPVLSSSGAGGRVDSMATERTKRPLGGVKNNMEIINLIGL